MPRVPVNIPQVGQTVPQLPGFQAPIIQPAQNFAPSTIGSIGQGLSQFGDSMVRTGAMVNREADQLAAEQERQQRIAEAEAKQKQADAERAQLRQDRFDDAVATDAKNQFSIYAKNQIAAFNKLSGADAATQYPKFAEELEKKRKELSDGLANDGQRKIFDSVTGLLITDYRNGMDKHAFDENEKYQRQTFAASAELNASNYIDSYMNGVSNTSNTSIDGKQTFGPYAGGYRIDPQAFKRAAESDLRRSMEGQPEELIQVALRKGASKVHGGILQRMVEAGRTDLIDGYIGSNRSEISDEDANKYGSIASRTEKSKGFITKAIAIATPIREKFKYYGSEQHSAVMRVLDQQLTDKQITEEEHAGLRSALVSLRENDEGIKTRFVGDVKMRAREAIKFLTSPDARQLSAASGFFGVPQLYAIGDEQSAESVFAYNNPDLYQQVIEVGAREELLAMLKSEKPRDDEAALAEIERDMRDDSEYYSNSAKALAFNQRYALRLSDETMQKHMDKFAAATDPAKMQNIRTKETLLREVLESEKVINRDGSPISAYFENRADYDSSKTDDAKLAALKNSLELEWNQHEAASEKKLTNDDYQKFIKGRFEGMKKTGLGAPISMRKPEDLTKISISYKSPSGTVVSRVYSDIDQQLVQEAQKILDKQNTMFSVMHQDASGASYTIASFDSLPQARDYQRANPNKLGGKLVIKNPSNQPETDIVKVGQKALELSIAGNVEPDIGLRSTRIKQWVSNQGMKSRVDYIPDWVGSVAEYLVPSGSAINIAKTAKDQAESKPPLVLKSLDIARDILSGNISPYTTIDPSMLTALTGHSKESAERAGLKMKKMGFPAPEEDYYTVNDIKKFVTEDTVRALETALEELSKEKQ